MGHHVIYSILHVMTSTEEQLLHSLRFLYMELFDTTSLDHTHCMSMCVCACVLSTLSRLVVEICYTNKIALQVCVSKTHQNYASAGITERKHAIYQRQMEPSMLL